MDLVELLNSAYLLAFLLGMITTIGILLYRVYEYNQAEWNQPVLLRRDLVLFLGLTSTILLILARRVFHLDDVVGEELWIIFTSTPPVAAIWYWLWQEFKLGIGIGRRHGNTNEPSDKGNQ